MSTDPLNELNKRYDRYYDKPSNFKKYFSGFFVKVLLYVGIFCCGLFILGFIFEKPIAEKIFQEVKGQLKTDLEVKEFNLSFFKSFPDVQIDFEEVVLKGVDNTPFVEAKALGFEVGVFSLLFSPINVKSIIVEEGSLFLTTNRKGKNNYDIFESEEADADKESKAISLNINNAIFNKVELIYEDEVANQFLKLDIKEGTLSGALNDKTVSLKSEATLLCHFIEMDQIRYLPGKTIEYDADFTYDFDKKQSTFHHFITNINGYPLSMQGAVASRDNGTWYDFKMGSQDGNIASLIQLIPGEYLPKSMKDLESNGDFSFNAYIKGLQSKKESPKMLVKLNLEDGTIDSKSLDASLRGISFDAKFDNGGQKNLRSASLKFSEIKGQYGKQKVVGTFDIKNFEDPTIGLDLDGTIDLAQIYSFLEIPNLKEASGLIKIGNLAINGKLRHLKDPRYIQNAKVKGNIALSRILFDFIAGEWEVPQGKMNFSNQLVKIDGLTIKGAENDLQLDGNFTNLFPVLFADSLNSKNASLKFNSNLVASEININEWNKLFENDSDETNNAEPLDSMSTQSIVKRNRVIKLLDGDFNADIKKLTYGKIHANAFEGTISVENQKVYLDGDLEAMSGSINLEGKLTLEDKPHLKMNLTCRTIDLNSFFEQNENFGQNLLTHKNLYGSLDALMVIDCYWNEKGVFMMDDLKLFGHLLVDDGRVKNFKMLENLRGLIPRNKLNDVRFSKLENWMEISNSTLYIPTMFIQNNAINLKLAGAHSFEQEIDYDIMVNGSQTIGRMFNSKVSEIIPNKTGFINIYTKIRGNVDDFDVINFKSRMVKASFKQQELRKNSIKAVIDREFGNSSIPPKPTKPDEKPQKKEAPLEKEPTKESGSAKDDWDEIEISEEPIFGKKGF